MSQQSERDRRIEAEIERIRANEAEKQQLYDRTIGGPIAPRPTPEFIRQNAGALKTEAEIRREAEAKILAQEKAEIRERENQRDVERSWKDHNARVERERSERPQDERREPERMEKPSLVDRIKAMSEGVSRNSGKGKEKDRSGHER